MVKVIYRLARLALGSDALRRLLFITSSLFGSDSKSRLVALELVEALRASAPNTEVIARDLDPQSTPHLTNGVLTAAMTPAERRTPDQQRLAAFADALIEEVEAADTIVMAVPMYNFSIPSTLKAWIDHLVRPGRTYRYGEHGPEGLLSGKRVFVVTGRGGAY